MVKPTSEWMVQSQSQLKTQYIVKRSKDVHVCDCHVSCKSCGVCTQLYTCTCLDSTLHSTVCKHIHLVVITETALNAACIVTNSPQPTDSSSYFTEILSHHIGNTDVSVLQGTVHSIASELLVITKECTDVSVLSVLKTQLQSAIATTRALSSTGTKTALNPKRKYAPNANHTKQQTFFSTKRRRVTSVNTIPKPTLEQIEQSRTKLTEEEPNFCGACLKENDSSGDSTVYWIQCSMCAMWIHTECTNAKIPPLQAGKQDDYVCKLCATV